MNETPANHIFQPENPLIFILSAPSGVGKSTISKRIAKQGYASVLISTTTRTPRPSEIEGNHYFFVSEDDFSHQVEQNNFFEWAKIYNNYYGTSTSQLNNVFAKNKNIILEIDIQGAKEVKKLMPTAISIFLFPPSIEELRTRLTKRDEDTPEEIQLRLSCAVEEMAHKSWYDYNIVNDNLLSTIDQIKTIIINHSKEKI